MLHTRQNVYLPKRRQETVAMPPSSVVFPIAHELLEKVTAMRANVGYDMICGGCPSLEGGVRFFPNQHAPFVFDGPLVTKLPDTPQLRRNGHVTVLLPLALTTDPCEVVELSDSFPSSASNVFRLSDNSLHHLVKLRADDVVNRRSQSIDEESHGVDYPSEQLRISLEPFPIFVVAMNIQDVMNNPFHQKGVAGRDAVDYLDPIGHRRGVVAGSTVEVLDVADFVEIPLRIGRVARDVHRLTLLVLVLQPAFQLVVGFPREKLDRLPEFGKEERKVFSTSSRFCTKFDFKKPRLRSATNQDFKLFLYESDNGNPPVPRKRSTNSRMCSLLIRKLSFVSVMSPVLNLNDGLLILPRPKTPLHP